MSSPWLSARVAEVVFEGVLVGFEGAIQAAKDAPMAAKALNRGGSVFGFLAKDILPRNRGYEKRR